MPRIPLVLLLLALATAPVRSAPIHDAAAGGDLRQVQALIAATPADAFLPDAKGRTPLHLAVRQRHPEIVEALLAASASANSRDQDGQTPLHFCADSAGLSVLARLRAAAPPGPIAETLARFQENDTRITPPLLLALLRNDLGKMPDPIRLLRLCSSLSTSEQSDGEIRCARALLAHGANPAARNKAGETPLHSAALSPHSTLARLLIKAGAPVEARTSASFTALHYAALMGGREVVDCLVSEGAVVDGGSALVGTPPLFLAVTRDQVEVTDALLHHGADLNGLGADGETALCRAALVGATQTAALLLKKGARTDVRFAALEHTPLHAAAAKGFTAMVELLLQARANPKARDRAGFTPLIDAAEHGQSSTARALLNAGAPIDDTTAIGRSALWLAASQGDADLTAFLLKRDAQPDLAPADGQTPLQIAAFNAHPETVDVLLKAGAKPELRGPLGTALHAAACGPSLHIVFTAGAKVGQRLVATGPPENFGTVARLLLQAGSALDATDAEGLTPLHLAAQFGTINVLGVLLARHAPLDAHNPRGLTPLHTAARGPRVPGLTDRPQPEIPALAATSCGRAIELLLGHGAALEGRDARGFTALHHAAASGNLPALDALLAAHANLAAPDELGATPLHWAAVRGHSDAVLVLLTAQAPVNATDAKRQTPLHLAVSSGNLESIYALLTHGADPNAVNAQGQDPLAYAPEAQRAAITELLHPSAPPTSPPAPNATPAP